MKRIAFAILLIFFSSVAWAGPMVTTGTNAPKTATTVEMQAGTETALRSVSPALVKAAIDALGGDVTGVGDCASGACLDGSSDGGTYIRLYDGTSAYLDMLAGVRTVTVGPSNANAEKLLITFGNNDNTIALSSTTGAAVSINGTAANASLLETHAASYFQPATVTYLVSGVLFGLDAQQYNIDGDGINYETATAGTTVGPDVAGHLIANVQTAINTANDGHNLEVRETTGTPTLTVEFDFSGVTSFNYIKVQSYYKGSASHDIVVELYNGATWDTVQTYSGEIGYTIHSLEVLTPATYIAAGVVKLRFRHVQAAVTSHYQRFDYVSLVNSAPSGGGSPLIASAVIYTPTGSLTSTNVQTAINELDSLSSATDVSATGNLTFIQMQNRVLNNYGQAAGDVTITAAEVTGPMRFNVNIGTAQAANFWALDWNAANPVYLDGTVLAAGNKIKIAVPTKGASLMCESFQTGAAEWSVNCYAGNGTFIDGGA